MKQSREKRVNRLSKARRTQHSVFTRQAKIKSPREVGSFDNAHFAIVQQAQLSPT
jgi:hypothetical protein